MDGSETPVPLPKPPDVRAAVSDAESGKLVVLAADCPSDQVEPWPAGGPGAMTVVTYCGDQVSQGFAIALRAMGIELAPPAISSVGRDDDDA